VEAVAVTWLIVVLVGLVLLCAVLAMRIVHLTTDLDTERQRTGRQKERGDTWAQWGLRMYAQVLAERVGSTTLVQADDALRGRYRDRDTAIQYGAGQTVRPVILPDLRTGDLADDDAAYDLRREVAS
jgi:hypothetical protein